MERKVIVTKDGSNTIEIPAQRVTYHSRHGALTESMHVFIEAGFQHWLQQHRDATRCNILEIGLGTGLNAYLTALEAEKAKFPVHYTAIEKYPLPTDEIRLLNYANEQPSSLMHCIHESEWYVSTQVSKNFILQKVQADLLEIDFTRFFDIIYFDAFAPAAQPELWTTEVFHKLYKALSPGGLLVTYCSKSVVRRAMEAAGFTIKKVPGPHGKREMVRAVRNG